MENQYLQISVPEHKQRERLDSFLSRMMSQLSRSQIQKLIKKKYIKVNNKPVKANHQVSPLEIIDIELPKPEPQDVIPESIPLNIVFEDEHLIVLNKEPGMVVHPAFGHPTGTLVNALLAHCNQLSDVNDVTRPGIVHRIDKDTSGLLVVAKNDFVHRGLAIQFQEKTVIREYAAVAWGKISKGKGTIETCLARSNKDRKKITVQKEGKRAVTHYHVMERFHLMSYAKLRLATGRTHQIRVHMTHIGHPVFGDQTYGGRGARLGGLNHSDMALAIQLLEMMPRQALHAKTLGFKHPVTKEDLLFDSELPVDIDSLIQKLRNYKADI